QETPARHEYTPIRTFVMAGKEGDFAFADLAPGAYHVIVSGEGPLEHLSAGVKMGDKDEEKSIAVAPFRVEGTAKIGQRPIAEGIVGMNDRTRWEEGMPIRDGKFGGVLWQTGAPEHAWIQTDEAHETLKPPELGADPTGWTIELKDRRVAGRVFDAETKQPVEHAELRIETATAHSRGYMSGKGQPDGSYAVVTAEDGTYTLKVSAPGYMAETAKFDFAETDRDSQSHDFALTRGVAATLEVLTPAGQPIAEAMIVDGVNSDGHNPDRFFSTGPDGRATVQMKPNEVRTLWVIPREGSFAVARVSAGEKPGQIVVPPPAGGCEREHPPRGEDQEGLRRRRPPLKRRARPAAGDAARRQRLRQARSPAGRRLRRLVGPAAAGRGHVGAAHRLRSAVAAGAGRAHGRRGGGGRRPAGAAMSAFRWECAA